MPSARKLRPFACVLLAVATVIGTAPAAAKVCGCPDRSRAPVQTSAAAPAASCDSMTPKRSCCGSGKGMRCCGHPAKPPAPNPAPSGCECLTCECESPAAPPADSVPPAPSATDSGSLQLAAVASVPPVVLPLPTADRPAPADVSAHPPPTDLVTTLSRFTC